MFYNKICLNWGETTPQNSPWGKKKPIKINLWVKNLHKSNLRQKCVTFYY